jgi:hypothetical protein
MAIELRLSKVQVEDLNSIRGTAEESLQAAAAILNDTNLTPLRPQHLISVLRESLGDVAEPIVRQAVALRGAMLQAKVAWDEVSLGLSTALRRDAEWDQHAIEAWSRLDPLLHNLVASRSIKLLTNAIDLSYEYAHLYRRARIITDIRPLFSDDASVVEASVISFTLRLKFQSVDGERELSIAMDEADVRQLMEQCSRAQTKAVTSRELMRRSNVPSIVTGEGGNA